MAGSDKPSPEDIKEALAVLEPFLAVLKSPSPITLPESALFGGITHFISVLPNAKLETFFQTLTTSPSLWEDLNPTRSRNVRHAIQLGVSSRAKSTRGAMDRTYFLNWRKRLRLSSWMGGMVNAVTACDTDLPGRIHVMIGILEGMADAGETDWGKGRVQLEEEIVVHLSRLAGKGNLTVPGDDLENVCSALLSIGETRLSVLPLQVSEKTIGSLTISGYCQ